MSVEKWSGNIAEFEVEAQLCPFLSSLGESVLADIREELAAAQEQATQVVEAAVSEEVPSPYSMTTRKLETEVRRLVQESSFGVPEAAQGLLGLEIRGEEQVSIAQDVILVPERLEAVAGSWVELAAEEGFIGEAERMATYELSLELPMAETVEPIESTAKSGPESDAAVAVPAVRQYKVVEVLQEMTTETAVAERPGMVIESTEHPIREAHAASESTAVIRDVAAHHDMLSEVDEPVPILRMMEESLRVSQMAAEDAEPQGMPIEAVRSQMTFSERLQDAITETVEAERRGEIEILVAKVYELAESAMLDPVNDGLALKMEVNVQAIVVELDQVVERLLQVLGVTEPTSGQVHQFVWLIRQEIGAGAAELRPGYWLDEGMHERLQDAPIAASSWWPMLAHKLLGKVALLSPVPLGR